MKRLAYLLADFPVLSETFVGDEIRAMRARGHEIEIIMMRRSTGPAQQADIILADTGTELASLPRKLAFADVALLSGVPAALAFVREQTRLPRLSLLHHAVRLARHFKATGTDHVHAHFAGGAAAHAIAAARLAGITCSFVCHGHDVYAEAEDLAVKLAYANRVVAVCNDMSHDLQGICPAAHISTIPCGISVEKFKPQDVGEHTERIIFIGRLVPQKGIADLFTALAQIEPTKRPKLDVVGEGPLEHDLKMQAEKLGLCDSVTFLGRQTSDWFALHGPRYKALIAPFRTAPDGARDSGPMVIKEAMAMGLPVISTRYMGVKEMVTDATGWLAEPGDTTKLAEYISVVSQLEAKARTAIGRAAREHVKSRFTLPQTSGQLSRLIEAL